MCVIIVKNAGIKLDKKVYETCFENNGHGAGLCYIKDKKLVISKGFGKFDEFYDREIEPNEELQLIIHFRVASAGMKVDAENCHPFSSKSDIDGGFEFALVHNGTLDWRSTKEMSDTNCFNQDFMVPIMNRDPWYFDQSVNRHIFERGVLDVQARTNKMVILRYEVAEDKSTVFILNKHKGKDAHGCWFSNDSYLPRVKVYDNLELWRMGNQHRSIYVHRYVKNKWLAPMEWLALIRDAREVMGKLTGDAKAAWDKLTWMEQQDYLEKKEGFANFDNEGKPGVVKLDKAEKKEKSILDLEKEREKKLTKHEAFRGVVRNKAASKWLDETQRRMLSAACLKHCRNAHGIDCTDWTIAEMMDWTRQDYKSFEVGCEHLGTPALDKYIIAVYEQEGNAEQPKPTVIADREFECYY